MGFHGIVVIDKSNKAGVPLLTTAETFFVVPHLHNSSDHSLGFAIGLRVVDAGELLSNAISLAGLNKLMVVAPPVFFAIIRIGVIDFIGTLINNLGQETQ